MDRDLPIVLDRTADSMPLAGQVARQLRAIAASGALKVGERLPSTRALARGLGVSRTVTTAAYEQLYAEGWIAGRHGSGTYLVAVPTPAPEGGADPFARVGAGSPPVAGSRAGEADLARSLGNGPTPPSDLRPGSPWAAGIQPAVWRRAWRAAAGVPPDPRPVRSGLPEFRAAVAEHAVRHRGLVASPAVVLATGGTTAALNELARAVLEPGSAIAVEEPGYPRAVGTLRAAGMRVVPAPVDQDGLMVDELPADVQAMYCTPAHQFPLGGTLPAGRRIELIAWARKNGTWIIEDDYDGELRYDVGPLPVLASLGPDVVIHLGTASKVLTPTLGCGWLVAPAEVVRAVTSFRVTTGTGPSPAGQRVFTALATTGDLARHLRRVRAELAGRRDLVVGELGAAGVTVLGDNAGGHVVLPLGDGDVEREVVRAAGQAGIAVDGLERCFIGPPTRAGLTLGYAAPARRAELADALARLRNTFGSLNWC